MPPLLRGRGGGQIVWAMLFASVLCPGARMRAPATGGRGGGACNSYVVPILRASRRCCPLMEPLMLALGKQLLLRAAEALTHVWPHAVGPEPRGRDRTARFMRG